MAYPVYSTKFVERLSFTGNAPYTVPAGYRAVVRDFALVTDVGPCEFYLYGALGQSIYYLAGVAANQWSNWTGRYVANAGETFGVQVPTGKADFALCGFLLAL